ncbi:Tudor domain-containing protein 1 [Holothuria leucospilota]|uniref:Tudor domain-containing protein 1 n=1 Tax=Holothuria leucospilota TaxID=206669 RepID=A0A9Q0YQN8_HOLLE|nr:Tudor domain-containing protein 1 [Holothuria leucospilota]
MDVVPNSQMFQVMFVDYGGEEEKTAEDFREMEQEFMKLAPQCLCLSLSGVSTMSGDNLKTFTAWVEGNNPCRGKVVEVSKDLISIRLHVIGDSANCINDKLAPKASIPLSPKKVDKSPQRTQERSVTGPGGDSKVSSNASRQAKNEAEKTKGRHQGEGKAVLPDPVQKTLKVNDSIKLEITGINQSGQSFYGYEKESEEVLLKLQARLQDCYAESQPPSGHRYQKGDYIVSRYSDGLWYRARIMDAVPNSQMFQVMFVDYGAEEEKTAEDFCKMEPEFMKLAPQCLSLSLSGVSAMSVNDLKTFAAWVEGNNPCQGKVVELSEDLISIRLHVIGDSANCINDKLAPKASLPLSPKKAEKSRTPDRSMSGPGGVATSSPRKENKKKILSVGENHKIAVVDGTSPGKFYACLLKDEKDISNLSEELAKTYGDTKPVKNFKPQVGQQCVAKFEGSWYRAEVTAVGESNQYEVFYIDYGNSSVVELNQCRPISPQFQEATPFALCLGLENINEECPQEYFRRFIEWVSKEGVVARIVGEAKGKYLVRLFRVDNEEECVNDILFGVSAKAPLPVPPLVSSVSLGTILDIVILSKQENPDFFYACLVDQQEELPEVGKVCCVRYKDGCFYRAVVGKIDGGTLQVLLLDYSDVAEVNIPDCYPLEDKFLRTPAYALCFRLEASSEMAPYYLNKFQNLDKVACKFEVTRKDGNVLVGIIWETDAPEERFNGFSKDKGATSMPPKKNVEPSSEKAVTKKKSSAAAKKEDSPVVTKNFLKASVLVKPPVPQIGKLLPASLTFLDNPNLIYFHLCFTETLDIIKSTINNPEFLKLKDSMKEYEPMKGELCMAFAVDQWCRAEVMNISGSSYDLSILDYGGEVTLSKKDIRPAPPTFLQTKLACVKCSLFGVEPLGMKNWSTKAKEFLIDCFILLQLEEGQKIVQLKVMAVEDDVLQVDILIPSENNRHRSLSQKLIGNGFSKQMLVTTEPVVSIPHPPDKADLLVTVNGINSPGDFYCQVVDEDSLKIIQTLMGAIMEFVSESSADKDFKPSVNQFCLGQFSEDQQWYRVQVVSVSEEDGFKILFIDFGNYETVSRNCLRPLPGHFVEPCAMAFPCCLSEAVTALSELTKHGLVALKGTVKRTRDYRTVICLTDKETGKDVSKELVKMVGNLSESAQSKPKASNNQPSPTTRETATSNGHPATTGGQATKPSPNASTQPDSTMSELERLRAELEAREAENRRLKELLERK